MHPKRNALRSLISFAAVWFSTGIGAQEDWAVEMDPVPLPEAGVPAHGLMSILIMLFMVLYVAFYFWMLFDSVRRYGLSWWIFGFVFFPGLCPIVYLALHYRHFMARTGMAESGPFGKLILNSKIKKAKEALYLSGTPAARSDLAELYLEARRYPECEELCEIILKEEPDNHEALYAKAVCRRADKDFSSTAELLKTILDKNPKYRFGKASLMYADALWELGQREQALEVSRKNTRTFPRPLTEYAYAAYLKEAGQYDKAREVLEDMLTTAHLAPKEDRMWVGKGRSLLRSVR